MSAPDEYKRSEGSKLADEAIATSKKELKPAPLPPPKKADEAKEDK